MATFRVLAVLFFCAAAFPSTYGQGRVIGGAETTIEERPYVASLQVFVGTFIHRCGASIISTKHLLTSALCKPNTLLGFYARVGSTNYTEGGQLLNVNSFIQHPNFVEGSRDYDVAVLSFPQNEEIILGSNVAIIPLASGSDPADDSMVTVTGWGAISELFPVNSKHLNEVDLPVFNRVKCIDRYYYFFTPRMICLGKQEGETGFCDGDEGSPAVQNGVQYGIASWRAAGCAVPNSPGVYTRVSSVRDWISSVSEI